jgi:protein-S-isoprenylcysteine O-methyltransferase Ste14
MDWPKVAWVKAEALAGRACTGSPLGTSEMDVVPIVILVAWVAFWVYWLVASASAKRGRQRWGQFAGFRLAIVLLVLLLLRLKVFKANAVVHNPWLIGIGLAVFLLGLALAVWARVYIGINWGMPMSRKENPDLVTTGPYSKVRHPIYSGIVLGIVGTALAVSLYWLIGAVVMGAYFIYSAANEERYMTEQFPSAYPEYKHSTKMLIPYVL